MKKIGSVYYILIVMMLFYMMPFFAFVFFEVFLNFVNDSVESLCNFIAIVYLLLIPFFVKKSFELMDIPRVAFLSLNIFTTFLSSFFIFFLFSPLVMDLAIMMRIDKETGMKIDEDKLVPFGIVDFEERAFGVAILIIFFVSVSFIVSSIIFSSLKKKEKAT